MMIRKTESVSSRVGYGTRSAGLLLVLAAALAGGCERRTTDGDLKAITVVDVQRRVAESGRKGKGDVILLIDPRAPQDYREGHIPGARNMRLADVSGQTKPSKDLAKYETIVVYGENPGSATAKAMTKRLLSIGYDSARIMLGGLAEWTAQGGQVVRGDR